jgi:hypothetical protein
MLMTLGSDAIKNDFSSFVQQMITVEILAYPFGMLGTGTNIRHILHDFWSNGHI